MGCRQWGNNSWWDGRSLLKVKVYEYAVYVDADQAPEAPEARPQGCLSDSLVHAGHVNMSVVIRAARNLPVTLLASEFEQVLQRRHAKAGGAPDDPALKEVVSCFSTARLPHAVLTGAGDAVAVRKGSTISFARGAGGTLVASAGPVVLGAVHSPVLCKALFDLYLGDMPVSKRAKAAANDNLARLVRGGSAQYAYEAAAGERLHCSPGSSAATCSVEVL